MRLFDIGIVKGLYLPNEFSQVVNEDIAVLTFPVSAYTKQIDGITLQPYHKKIKEALKSLPDINLELKPELTNQYDPSAIRVYWVGIPIGYVPKNISGDLNKHLHAIQSVYTKETKEFPNGYSQVILTIRYSISVLTDQISPIKNTEEFESKSPENLEIDDLIFLLD